MNIAIIGSGPSAFYTVQSFLREKPLTNIDIFEKLPAPFGLVRYGVAPDHQKTKNIIRLFTKYLNENNVNYYGNVEIGKTISLNTLSDIYDAVVVSSGAPEDKGLDINNNSTVQIYGSAQFVGWYNGNPIHSKLSPNLNSQNIIIIGNGNVALDCARVLAKTKEEFYQSDIMQYALNSLNKSSVENIYIVGRRTPKDAKFTISELREMADLKMYKPEVDYDEEEMLKVLDSTDIETKVKKNIEALIDFKKFNATSKRKIIFKFLSTPYKVINENGINYLLLKKNKLLENKIISTETIEKISTDLIITAIGYRVSPIEGLEIEPNRNFFVNSKGHIKANIYTNGWASGASVGVIGSNKIGASLLVKKIINEVSANKNDARKKLLEYFSNNSISYITKSDWKKIDQIEIDSAKENFTRNKLVDIKTINNQLEI
tara:strand:+ start:864 stop:2156 length:1293 start_codon:yes stop_codon:yes gene_type:complete